MATNPGPTNPKRAYRNRVVDAEVPVALRSARAVLIEGPKGCGKTWTGQHFAQSEMFVEERPDLWDIAPSVPGLFLDGATPRLLDEWQRVLDLWHLVRAACDRRGLPGQFILTGSAVPADELTRHSGAGRISRVRMRPMALWEAGLSTGAVSLRALLEGQGVSGAEASVDVPGLVDAACRGGWPQLIDTPTADARRFTRDYLSDICRVDVSAVDGIRRSPTGVMRLITVAGSQHLHHRRFQEARSRYGRRGPFEPDHGEAVSRRAEPSVRGGGPARVEHAPQVTGQPGPALPSDHFVDPSLASAALGAGPQRYLDDLNAFGYLFESMAGPGSAHIRPRRAMLPYITTGTLTVSKPTR